MTENSRAAQALNEVGAVLQSALPDQLIAMAEPIRTANRIALYGVGREGLMMKSLAMRLFHLGLDAHVVGDMTTPPLAKGDLLIVSAGPGQFSTVAALVNVAKSAEATTMCVTAELDGAVPRMAHHVIHLPAQTMANDLSDAHSILPMGSLYEAAQFMFFELLVLRLREELGTNAEDMRANHTNLE